MTRNRRAGDTTHLRTELDDLAGLISAPYVPPQEQTFETLNAQGQLARLRGHSPLNDWAPTLLHLCYWGTDASDWAASELTRLPHDPWTDVLLRTCACRGRQGRPDELLDALTHAVKEQRSALDEAPTAATLLWSTWVLSEHADTQTLEDLAGLIRASAARRIYRLIRRGSAGADTEWRGLPRRGRIPLWLLAHDTLATPQQLLHEPQNARLLRQRLIRPRTDALDRDLTSNLPRTLSWLLPTLNLRPGPHVGPPITIIIGSWSPQGMPEPDLTDDMSRLRRHLACVPSPPYLVTDRAAHAVNQIEASCWINLALSLVPDGPMTHLPWPERVPSVETRRKLRDAVGKQVTRHNLPALILAQELLCIFTTQISLSSVQVEEETRDEWKVAFRRAVNLLEQWIGAGDEGRQRRIQAVLRQS